MRIDKWLWTVRFYKSRTLASLSCKSSKVKINGHEAKASSSIKIGDLIEIKKNGFYLKYQVLGLPEKELTPHWPVWHIQISRLLRFLINIIQLIRNHLILI